MVGPGCTHHLLNDFPPLSVLRPAVGKCSCCTLYLQLSCAWAAALITAVILHCAVLSLAKEPHITSRYLSAAFKEKPAFREFPLYAVSLKTCSVLSYGRERQQKILGARLISRSFPSQFCDWLSPA